MLRATCYLIIQSIVQSAEEELTPIHSSLGSMSYMSRVQGQRGSNCGTLYRTMGIISPFYKFGDKIVGVTESDSRRKQ